MERIQHVFLNYTEKKHNVKPMPTAVPTSYLEIPEFDTKVNKHLDPNYALSTFFFFSLKGFCLQLISHYLHHSQKLSTINTQYHEEDHWKQYLPLCVTKNNSLGDGKGIIKITQSIKLPLLPFYCNEELLDTLQYLENIVKKQLTRNVFEF